MTECNATFYSAANIIARLGRNLLVGRNPLFSLVSNLTSRRNSMRFAQVYRALWQTGAGTDAAGPLPKPRPDPLEVCEIGLEQLRRLAAAFKLQVAWLFRQP
jgi:hypothetical protein